MAIKDSESSNFLDIKASLFRNKSNGQISLTLPKKELRKIMNFDNKETVNPIRMPKKIPIRIFKWRDN